MFCMSTLKSKAMPIFQLDPCEENGYISFSEEEGRLIAYTPQGGDERYTKARNSVLEKYDTAIKSQYGEDHFHGEEGLPLGMPIREYLDSL